MQELEKILEETEQLVNMHYEDDSVKTIILRNLRGIRKHMNDGWIPAEDLSGCDIELKPCPFCGCGAEMFVRGDDRYTARCRSCFCGTGEYKDPGRASEAWNRRADNEQNNRQ